MDSGSEVIEWSVYAEHYDAMCLANPSYQEMISRTVRRILNLELPTRPSILDVGAGTGNLILALSEVLPDAEFTYLDSDTSMAARAKHKLCDVAGLNVSFQVEDFQSSTTRTGTYDLIVSTNALYAIYPHRSALSKIYDALHEDGHLVVVDFGREQNTNDWAIYIAIESLKKIGLASTLKLFRDNWEVAKQNRKTTQGQSAGTYWLHETHEFKRELEAVGFAVESVEKCYRGYSDLAVCTKKQMPIPRSETQKGF